MKKNIKKINLTDKTIIELQKLLKDAEEECFKQKMELKISKLKNVHTVRIIRKEIARLKTVIREKELLNLNKSSLK